MPHEEQTERAPTDTKPNDGAMSTKEKVDAALRLLGMIFSWPFLMLIIVLMIREQLPGIAGRLEEFKGGPVEVKLAAIEQKLDTNTEQLQTVAEQVDTIQRNLVEFRPSANLTEDLQADIEATLAGFSDYLTRVGFDLPAEPAAVEVESGSGATWYDPRENLIHLSDRGVDNPDVPLREYAHHVLFSMAPEGGLGSEGRNIESGLAFYYPASFTNEPNIGLWNLSDANTFAAAFPLATPDPGFRPFEAAVTWAGAFWEMRNRFGQDRVDRALLAAWSADVQPSLGQLERADFVQRILDALATDGGPDVSAQVREIFTQRGITAPG